MDCGQPSGSFAGAFNVSLPLSRVNRMDADFWANRRVLVTGHTGFKGSWLSLYLNLLGARTTGLALDPPTDPSLYETADVRRTLQDSYTTDVRDANAVQQVLEASQPEVVFHLAAQPLVRESYNTPLETYEVNVMGVANVLEAVRHTSSVRSVVVVTSDKCYENREWLWGYREDEPMGGHDPYSSSKGCAELVAASYRRSFFTSGEVGIGTARAGNVIGGGDWAADRLVPDILRKLHEGETIDIRNPRAVRPWQHVMEPLRGYLMLAKKLFFDPERAQGAWNFGPQQDDVISVGAMADLAVKIWGSGAWTHPPQTEAPHEATLLNLDCSKANYKLDWRPQMNVEQALTATIEWSRAAHSGVDMQQFTTSQIAAYAGISTGNGRNAAA